jgi:hypothetical protein
MRLPAPGRVNHPTTDGQKFDGAFGDSVLDAVKVGRVGGVPFLAAVKDSSHESFRQKLPPYFVTCGLSGKSY